MINFEKLRDLIKCTTNLNFNYLRVTIFLKIVFKKLKLFMNQTFQKIFYLLTY